jgi:hypothetical protein
MILIAFAVDLLETVLYLGTAQFVSGRPAGTPYAISKSRRAFLLVKKGHGLETLSGRRDEKRGRAFIALAQW